MSLGRKIAGSMVMAALLATSTTPALARRGDGWGNGWGHNDGWRHRHRRDRGGISGGDVLAGILILGGIAAVASVASKNKKQRDRDYDGYPRDRGNINSESAAVDACAAEAERRAGSNGRNASVRDITNVASIRDGWEISGVVETRNGYRDDYAENRYFSCAVRYGAIDNVTIDSTVAYR